MKSIRKDQRHWRNAAASGVCSLRVMPSFPNMTDTLTCLPSDVAGTRRDDARHENTDHSREHRARVAVVAGMYAHCVCTCRLGTSADCRLPAAGDDDRQGGIVNSNEPGPIEEEDFDSWRDDHAHRVLSQGQAYGILQPVLEKMCEAKVVQGEIYCPFSATGLRQIERLMGKTVYQPVAHACGLPMHPSCTQRCSDAKVACRRPNPFKLFKAFAVHVNASRSTAVEDDDDDDTTSGHLHQLLRCAIANLVSPGAPDRAERVAWQRAAAPCRQGV